MFINRDPMFIYLDRCYGAFLWLHLKMLHGFCSSTQIDIAGLSMYSRQGYQLEVKNIIRRAFSEVTMEMDFFFQLYNISCESNTWKYLLDDFFIFFARSHAFFFCSGKLGLESGLMFQAPVGISTPIIQLYNIS